MLKIRLSRKGRKNNPFFRIIVSDSRFDTQGRYLENLGHFDPKNKFKTLVLHKERILHWLARGAKSSPTVHNLLVEQKVIKGSKIKATTIKKKQEDKKEENVGADLVSAQKNKTESGEKSVENSNLSDKTQSFVNTQEQ